jgi:hypothetical protein
MKTLFISSFFWKNLEGIFVEEIFTMKNFGVVGFSKEPKLEGIRRAHTNL